jgi:hypothetical protein
MASDVAEMEEQKDMRAYAEQVVKDVDAERSGEKAGKGEAKKGDAQITSEQANLRQPADKTKTAEKHAGSDDTVEVDDRDEEPGDDKKSWWDDNLKAEAAAYGIEESELSDFASREEFERTLKFFDKSALAVGRKAMAEEEGEKGQSRNEKGQFTKREVEKKEESKTDTPKKDGRYEITLDRDVYDDGLVDELNRLRDHYESRLEALEARFSESDATAEERHFDSLVDSLGHADLFGKTDKESPQELQRRKDLMVAVKAQMIGLERLGRPAELNESLVNRVARMVFAEELSKKDLKQRTRKISKQSNGRQGGGATRPQDPREDPREEADRLYRELERS